MILVYSVVKERGGPWPVPVPSVDQCARLPAQTIAAPHLQLRSRGQRRSAHGYRSEVQLPLLPTPPYADYDSGHQSISRSSATVLIAYFGDSTPVEGFSEAPSTNTRRWTSFTAAAD